MRTGGTTLHCHHTYHITLAFGNVVHVTHDPWANFQSFIFNSNLLSCDAVRDNLPGANCFKLSGSFGCRVYHFQCVDTHMHIAHAHTMRKRDQFKTMTTTECVCVCAIVRWRMSHAKNARFILSPFPYQTRDRGRDGKWIIATTCTHTPSYGIE